MRTSETRHDPNGASTLWRDLSEKLGILGLLVLVDGGGLGRSCADMIVVMDELGSALADVPFLDALVMALFLLAPSLRLIFDHLDVDETEALAGALLKVAANLCGHDLFIA